MVDDELAAIENLTRVLEWFCEDDVEVLGYAHQLEDAMNLINTNEPDLVFLDVDMGKENGFMLLNRIQKRNPRPYVIFTTGHSEFAVKAFRQEAFDYLLKPVDPTELSNAINRLKEKMAKESEAPAAQADGPATLMLPTQNQIHFCKIEDIVRCESESNYTRFHFVDKSSLLVSKHLGSFVEKLLPHRFFRPHKSHLINLAQLKSYIRSEGGYLLMKDDSQVPLARNQRQPFFDLMEM